VTEIVLSRQELQILTNTIYRGDTRYLHVGYPLYDIELFTLDIAKPELTKIVRPDQLDWARSQRKPLDRSVSADELPTFNDLKNCLLSSRFLSYKNEKEVARELADLRDEVRDPNKRPRPVFVAIDTNVLYERFLSRHMPLSDTESGRTVDASDFRYALSEIVQIEVDSKITHKYSRDEIQGLTAALGHGDLLKEFSNGSGRRERLAKLAFNEMNHVMTELKALRVRGTPTRGKEENDIEIAQSYRNWARNGQYDVLLLTADEDMVNHARTSELMTLQLEFPYDVPEHGRLDPWRASDLIYDLAAVFGVIGLNDSMLVFGEWAGKSSSDYQRENVKVRMKDVAEAATVAKQLDVCRKVLQKVHE
jgi:hypothetical protein